MHLPLAYIDPGSGSLIIQVAIASIVAIPIFFRHQISRAVGVFRRQPASTDAAATSAPAAASVTDATDPGESA